MKNIILEITSLFSVFFSDLYLICFGRTKSNTYDIPAWLNEELISDKTFLNWETSEAFGGCGSEYERFENTGTIKPFKKNIKNTMENVLNFFESNFPTPAKELYAY